MLQNSETYENTGTESDIKGENKISTIQDISKSIHTLDISNTYKKVYSKGILQ
jgi:hypothetical protein